MSNYKVRELISEEKVIARIKEIAEQINQDYEGKSVTLICILKGSSMGINLPNSIMQCVFGRFYLL